MTAGKASEMQDKYCETICDQVEFAFEDMQIQVNSVLSCAFEILFYSVIF